MTLPSLAVDKAGLDSAVDNVFDTLSDKDLSDRILRKELKQKKKRERKKKQKKHKQTQN